MYSNNNTNKLNTPIEYVRHARRNYGVDFNRIGVDCNIIVEYIVS